MSLARAVTPAAALSDTCSWLAFSVWVEPVIRDNMSTCRGVACGCQAVVAIDKLTEKRWPWRQMSHFAAQFMPQRSREALQAASLCVTVLHLYSAGRIWPRQLLHQACRDHVQLLFPRQKARGDRDSSSVTFIVTFGQGSHVRSHFFIRSRLALCRQIHPFPFNF